MPKLRDDSTPGYYAEVAEKAVKEMRKVLFKEGLSEKEALAVLGLIGVNLRTAVEGAKKDADAA